MSQEGLEFSMQFVLPYWIYQWHSDTVKIAIQHLRQIWCELNQILQKIMDPTNNAATWQEQQSQLYTWKITDTESIALTMVYNKKNFQTFSLLKLHNTSACSAKTHSLQQNQIMKQQVMIVK